MMDMFYLCASNRVAASHVWLVKVWNVASVMDNLNL